MKRTERLYKTLDEFQKAITALAYLKIPYKAEVSKKNKEAVSPKIMGFINTSKNNTEESFEYKIIMEEE